MTLTYGFAILMYQDNPDKCDELDKFQVKIINNYP